MRLWFWLAYCIPAIVSLLRKLSTVTLSPHVWCAEAVWLWLVVIERSGLDLCCWLLGIILALLLCSLQAFPPSHNVCSKLWSITKQACSLCVHFDVVKLKLGCNYLVTGACKLPTLAGFFILWAAPVVEVQPLASSFCVLKPTIFNCSGVSIYICQWKRSQAGLVRCLDCSGVMWSQCRNAWSSSLFLFLFWYRTLIPHAMCKAVISKNACWQGA